MIKEIHLAGGCFWGTEQFFKLLDGVVETEVGFANGHTDNPTYEQVYTDTTGYAETVRIRYDNERMPLPTLIGLFFKIIDPTSLNRQGHDVGTRYRTGIYYSDSQELPAIRAMYEHVAREYDQPLCVEVEPLANFVPADEYHQDYLDKNPTGYCHLPISLFAEAKQYKAIRNILRDRLLALQDLGYRNFHAQLVPNLPPEKIIGVRTPALRQLAKEFARHPDIVEFLLELPHRYYEEYNLHGMILAEERDYSRCVAAIDRLLPYIDNWATCDLLRPKAFRRNHPQLLRDIRRWLRSRHPYTLRFGIEMLMTHFLDDDFRPEQLEWVARVQHDDYYVRMMVAWYFATALAKQYPAAIPYLQEHRLSPWIHQKTIQKALESFRIPAEEKAEIRKLREPSR